MKKGLTVNSSIGAFIKRAKVSISRITVSGWHNPLCVCRGSMMNARISEHLSWPLICVYTSPNMGLKHICSPRALKFNDNGQVGSTWLVDHCIRLNRKHESETSSKSWMETALRMNERLQAPPQLLTSQCTGSSCILDTSLWQELYYSASFPLSFLCFW